MAYEIMYHGEWKNGKLLGVINGIRCLDCGLVSYNPHDFKHKYCGKCDKFHKEELASKFTQTDKPQVGPLPEYRKCKGVAKNSHKVHYTVNSKNTLCMVKVFGILPTMYRGDMCKNCVRLKDQGFNR